VCEIEALSCPLIWNVFLYARLVSAECFCTLPTVYCCEMPMEELTLCASMLRLSELRYSPRTRKHTQMELKKLSLWIGECLRAGEVSNTTKCRWVLIVNKLCFLQQNPANDVGSLRPRPVQLAINAIRTQSSFEMLRESWFLVYSKPLKPAPVPIDWKAHQEICILVIAVLARKHLGLDKRRALQCLA